MLLPIWFSGGYKTGFAHIDTQHWGSTNFYCMMKGRKRVIVVPKGLERHLPMRLGRDNVYVVDSINDETWVKHLPTYWVTTLEPGQALCFNNTCCVHQFSNVDLAGGKSLALSLRIHCWNASPVHLAAEFHPKFWVSLTQHALFDLWRPINGSLKSRDPADI